jgi:hypothetical protein
VGGSVLGVGLLALVGLAQDRNHPTSAIVLYLFISLVYLILVTRFSGAAGPGSLRFVLGFALLFRLVATWMAPVFTDDLYRYRWEGRLQLAGGNPYQARPGDARWSALRDETFPLVDGKDFKAVYGPLVEHLQREMARLSDGLWIHKLPSILADLALLLLLARWHGPRAALLYGWCPLAVVEFAGMGHNDALLILALALAMRYRSGLALGIAIAVKWWPALLLPAFFRADRRTAWAVLVPAVLFLPYLSDVRENADFASGFLGGWSNNPSLFWVIEFVSPNAGRGEVHCDGSAGGRGLLAAAVGAVRADDDPGDPAAFGERTPLVSDLVAAALGGSDGTAPRGLDGADTVAILGAHGVAAGRAMGGAGAMERGGIRYGRGGPSPMAGPSPSRTIEESEFDRCKSIFARWVRSLSVSEFSAR